MGFTCLFETPRMKLYMSPGACSLSPMIALNEAGLDAELVKVDIHATPHKLADGADFATINPRNQVPALKLDGEDEVLVEGPTIIQYIADQVPNKSLAAPNGTMERYRLQSVLNFLTSEVHKSFGPIMQNAEAGEQDRARAKLEKKFAVVEDMLGTRSFVLGHTYTVADGYLFLLANWAQKKNISLPNAVLAHHERVSARPATQKALADEARMQAA